MPTSDFSPISSVLYKVFEVNPKSVLDTGIGWGKYGVLLREYLDFNKGNIDRKDWKVKIDGIEVFKAYQNANWARYSSVRIGDVRKLKLGKYDVILLCDVLEHMKKNEAFKLLDRCVRKAKRVIVTTPVGLVRQGSFLGNGFERHVCGFLPKEFAGYSKDAVVFKNVFMVSIDGKR